MKILTRIGKALVTQERLALIAVEDVRMSGGRSMPALLRATKHTLAVAGLRMVERVLDAAEPTDYLDR